MFVSFNINTDVICPHCGRKVLFGISERDVTRIVACLSVEGGCGKQFAIKANVDFKVNTETSILNFGNNEKPKQN